MSRIVFLRNGTHSRVGFTALLSTSTDIYLDNLVIEAGKRREKTLIKYFRVGKLESSKTQTTPHLKPTKDSGLSRYMVHDGNKEQEIITHIEKELKCAKVPNEYLNLQLIYFSKNGNITGVKAIQTVIQRHNKDIYDNQSGYNHFLAEALWINGRIEESLYIFFEVYNNPITQSKVRLMLSCLFPILVTQHCEGKLIKVTCLLENFSNDKEDLSLLVLLWKELFKSSWFSNQQLAAQILERNTNLIQVIQWNIPALGKDLLKSDKIEDFYRLIELSLHHGLKRYTQILLQLLFDYYYIHENISRCSEVVKYCITLESPLSEAQQKRYLELLLKPKDSMAKKANIKPPQNIRYKF